MRILTVFSSILLPLAFLTSIFGMQGFDLNNIHSIPQGFTALLIAMTIISVVCFGKGTRFLFQVKFFVRRTVIVIINELWLSIRCNTVDPNTGLIKNITTYQV
jgi:hypothetical protein